MGYSRKYLNTFIQNQFLCRCKTEPHFKVTLSLCENTRGSLAGTTHKKVMISHYPCFLPCVVLSRLQLIHHLSALQYCTTATEQVRTVIFEGYTCLFGQSNYSMSYYKTISSVQSGRHHPIVGEKCTGLLPWHFDTLTVLYISTSFSSSKKKKFSTFFAAQCIPSCSTIQWMMQLGLHKTFGLCNSFLDGYV